MHITTFDEFTELATRGTFVPVYKEIVADLLTPVSAFLKIAEHSDYAFLLESVEGGEQVGRYSFLGKDPFLILRSRAGKTFIDRAGQTSESDKPFVPMLRELMAEFHSPMVSGLPRFTGGAVGYLGYDAAAWFEPVTLQPTTEVEDEAGYMLFDTVLAFDHVRHRILIIANARITGSEDLESLYEFACAKIEFVERELDRTLSKTVPTERQPIQITSNVTRDEFEGMVRTAKEHIAAGDIYQVVLSQRFETRFDADPFMAYRALRHTAGFHVLRRSPASTRDRSDPRLGTVAFSGGRARAGVLRRHASLRACRSAPGIPPGVEQLDLQLRPRGSARLPRQQRPLLARQVSR